MPCCAGMPYTGLVSTGQQQMQGNRQHPIHHEQAPQYFSCPGQAGRWGAQGVGATPTSAAGACRHARNGSSCRHGGSRIGQQRQRRTYDLWRVAISLQRRRGLLRRRGSRCRLARQRRRVGGRHVVGHNHGGAAGGGSAGRAACGGLHRGQPGRGVHLLPHAVLHVLRYSAGRMEEGSGGEGRATATPAAAAAGVGALSGHSPLASSPCRRSASRPRPLPSLHPSAAAAHQTHPSSPRAPAPP